jgi:hypothetical protein
MLLGLLANIKGSKQCKNLFSTKRSPEVKVQSWYFDFTKSSESLVPVAHAYNPSYSGRQRSGRSWFEARPRQIVHETLSQKNPSQERAGRVAQGVGPESKPQYCKKQNKTKQKTHQESRNLSSMTSLRVICPHDLILRQDRSGKLRHEKQQSEISK